MIGHHTKFGSFVSDGFKAASYDSQSQSSKHCESRSRLGRDSEMLVNVRLNPVKEFPGLQLLHRK